MNSKLRIALGVIGLILLGVLYKYQSSITNWFDNTIDKEVVTKPEARVGVGSTLSTTTNESTSLCDKPFEYIEAEDGVRKGVIEVGSKGFNAFAVMVDADKIIYL